MRDRIDDNSDEATAQQHFEFLREVYSREWRLAESARDVHGIQAHTGLAKGPGVQDAVAGVKKEVSDPARDRGNATGPESTVLQEDVVPERLLDLVVEGALEVEEDAVQLRSPRGQVQVIQEGQALAELLPVFFGACELNGRDAASGRHSVLEVALDNVHEDDGMCDAGDFVRRGELCVQGLECRHAAQILGNLSSELVCYFAPVVRATAFVERVITYRQCFLALVADEGVPVLLRVLGHMR